MRYFATYLIYIAVIARAIGWNQETAPIPTTIWILLAIFGVILFSEQALTRRFPLYPRLYTLGPVGTGHCHAVSSPRRLIFSPCSFIPLSFQAVQFFHDLDRLCLDRRSSAWRWLACSCSGWNGRRG